MDELERLRREVRELAKPLIAEGRRLSMQREGLRALEQDLRLHQKEIKRTVERLRIAHRAMLQAEQQNKAGWTRLLSGAEQKQVRLRKHARRLVDLAAKRRKADTAVERSGWFAALKQRVQATLGGRPISAKGSVTAWTDRLTIRPWAAGRC